MVSGGVFIEGREICLGVLTFIADDSAWLQEAPLDIDALHVRGATVDPVSVDYYVVLPPCLLPAQALRSVEASAVGEARGGSPIGHSPGRGDRARRISLRPVRLAP